MLIIHALLDPGNNMTNGTSVVSHVQKYLREYSQMKHFKCSEIHEE